MTTQRKMTKTLLNEKFLQIKDKDSVSKIIEKNINNKEIIYYEEYEVLKKFLIGKLKRVRVIPGKDIKYEISEVKKFKPCKEVNMKYSIKGNTVEYHMTKIKENIFLLDLIHFDKSYENKYKYRIYKIYYGSR